MKITDEGMQRLLNRYIHQQSKTVSSKEACLDSNRSEDKENVFVDKVTLSKQALEIQHALRGLQKLADARQEKIESIRKNLESGTYDVTGKQVVDKLLEP